MKQIGEGARAPRDPRLDFFRGLGMFIILVAHIPWNPWTNWIPARFGFSDAADLFVFCSGMASALAFAAVFDRNGLLIGALRILHRVWQVYWAHIGGFFVVLGLVSGMIGIGGGILLSPLLLLFGWSTAKESAAVSAAFIFVNSAAGLVSLALSKGLDFYTSDHLFWIAAALMGGSLGAYVGAQRFSQLRLRQVLGVVLLLASFKLFFA